MKSRDIMYPGDEVRVTEGRYKGKIGVIVSMESYPKGGKTCDVKFYHSKRSIQNDYNDSMLVREYNITTKLNIFSLELVSAPSDAEEDTHKIGRRLLLIPAGGDKI